MILQSTYEGGSGFTPVNPQFIFLKYWSKAFCNYFVNFIFYFQTGVFIYRHAIHIINANFHLVDVSSCLFKTAMRLVLSVCIRIISLSSFSFPAILLNSSCWRFCLYTNNLILLCKMLLTSTLFISLAASTAFSQSVTITLLLQFETNINYGPRLRTDFFCSINVYLKYL